jgi:hypothetical protein
MFGIVNNSALADTPARGARRHVRHHQQLRVGQYFGLRGSPSSLASSTTPPRPILRLKGLTVTFGTINNSASTDTPARGARRHLQHHQQLCLGRYSGSRGSSSPSAPSTTMPRPILQLEGLAVTFSFTSNVALATTTACGARRDLLLQI